MLALALSGSTKFAWGQSGWAPVVPLGDSSVSCVPVEAGHQEYWLNVNVRLGCRALQASRCVTRSSARFLHGVMQDILDEWLKCQQGWLYLEPIFGSEDIMQQMPNEGRKFKAVDANWRRIMAGVQKMPEVLVVTADDELLKSLMEANKLLDQVCCAGSKMQCGMQPCCSSA